MINLSVKLSRSEFKDLSLISGTVLKIAQKKFSEDDYFHYYNLRSFFKRVLDKMFSMDSVNRRSPRSIAFRINVNEYESFLYSIDLVSEEISLDPYYGSLLRRILDDLNKQKIRISHRSNYYLPD
jgi:hypothetical protein